ncbi:hypothetical protein SAMN05216338_104662 [Bradyrhizobium sp. Rc2d]|nr:hypothetical protein SAMN05216338_104662 [Bradyrhizobium sp. Rc2d]
MSIHWTPVTDQIYDHLHVKYLLWIEDLTEIRERMDALRDVHRVGWKPPAELRERLDDLNERDELYAARHMATARAFLDAAEADAAATEPERSARKEALIAAVALLRHAWENGWQTVDKWTPEERSELMWLIHCNPELKTLFNTSAQNVVYFYQKYERLHERYKQYERLQLGLGVKPKLKPSLGMKRFGKGIRK